MRFRRVVILSALSFVACKTMSREIIEAPEPDPAVASPAPVEEESPPIPPSPALQTTPNLVKPGPDEVLIRRGPDARCPTALELDDIESAVQSLGRDTISLVGEDLVNIRKTSSRTDREGINSCCNQLEQLVQDVEVMNEDKAGAVPFVERIRRITVRLCPPS
jgi:hypothetical protein